MSGSGKYMEEGIFVHIVTSLLVTVTQAYKFNDTHAHRHHGVVLSLQIRPST